MISRLFMKTVVGGLVVGAIVALYDFEYFVPGTIIGAIAALLTFGIREPETTVLDLLNDQSDTNVFKAFIADMMARIEEFGNDGAAAVLLLAGTDTNNREEDARVVTLFVPMDIYMCSDEMMILIKKLRKNPEEWKAFLLSHLVDTNFTPKELKARSSVTTMSGRVLLLDKLREANIEMLPFPTSNGTLYKLRSPLIIGRFLKEVEKND